MSEEKKRGRKPQLDTVEKRIDDIEKSIKKYYARIDELETEKVRKVEQRKALLNPENLADAEDSAVAELARIQERINRIRALREKVETETA